MSSMIQNKLVRDKIPSIIRATGERPVTFPVKAEHIHTHLCLKASEELLEFQKATDEADKLEELADVLEVIHALAKLHDISLEDLEYARRAKFAEKGGYDNRIYLVKVDPPYVPKEDSK